MFDRLGVTVSRGWVFVLLAWVVLAAAVKILAPSWDSVTHDGDFAYLPEQMTSVRGEELLQTAFPDVRSKSNLALVVSRSDGKLGSTDFDVVEELAGTYESSIDEDSPIIDVLSPQSRVIGKKLTSRDGRAALVVLHLRNEFMAIDNMDLVEAIFGTVDRIQADGKLPSGTELPEGLELGVTGSAAVGYDMLDSARTSIQITEKMTILLVIVVLLLVYRAPGLVIVPLLTIGASVLVAMGVVAMAAQFSQQVDWLDFKIFKTTKIFVVVILFGAGTDYCLFLISRYREELQRGLDPGRAIAVALGQVGNALAASALTTIVGLGMMYFADFGKFRNSGPAIALCLLVALAACITLAPALLRAIGRNVFWPFGVGEISDSTNTARQSAASFAAGDAVPAQRFGRLWQGLSRGIIARPGLILVVSVLLLLSPLAWKGLPAAYRGVVLACQGKVQDGWNEAKEGVSTRVTYDLLNELQADRHSVRGTRMMGRHFATSEISPVIVLARDPKGGFDTKEGKYRIAGLTKDLYEVGQDETVIDGKEYTVQPIWSVRSLRAPLGNRAGNWNLFDPRIWEKFAVIGRRETKAIYRSADGKVARFDLVFQYDPFSKDSVDLLDKVDKYLQGLAKDPKSDWHQVEFLFAGTTAGISDLEEVTTSDQKRIQTLVVLAVLFVLVLILRRPMICVYLILSVLLGYFVTIGITELFFESYYAYHGEDFHGLDWKVPIFLFVILIAIGEDYNIYLATRVFEEQARLGPREGLRVAVVRTGGIITSCGVIMAGTFASMIFGTLRAMDELGFALSLGVLLDTFVIRTIVVPAFLAILARRSERNEQKGPRDAAPGQRDEIPPVKARA